MVIYSTIKHVLEDSFIGNNKLILANFDDKIFTDHLSIRDITVMYKSLFFRRSNNIFCNYEDINHRKFRYYKPIGLFDNIISFSDYGKNCFYYNIGTEHIINDNFVDLRKSKIKKDVNSKDDIFVGWVCSNFGKIKTYWDLVKSLHTDVKLYGSFGLPVKQSVTLFDVQRNFIHSSQNYIKNMDAHICIENTNSVGYFSAMPGYAIFSGTAPIIMGDNLIHRKIFSKNSYIEYNDKFTKKELINVIKKCKDFIINSDYKELFTSLYLEYLDFLKQANFFISQDIKKSKEFRKKMID